MTRRAGRFSAVVTAVVLGAVWMMAPSWQGRDPVVVVAVDVGSVKAAEAMAPTFREFGVRLELVGVDAGWCGLESMFASPGTRDEVDLVVMDPDPLCPAPSMWPDGVVVVHPSGAAGASSPIEDDADTSNRLDVTWSLGDGGTLRRPCETREDCEFDGQVTLRREPGVLTPLGWARLGRVLAVAR